MRLRTSATCAIVLSCLGFTAAGEARRADDPIAAINRVIQERFKEIDSTFGLRRIVVLGDTPHRFQPERIGELAAVKALTQARLQVALYLAGRTVLHREPESGATLPSALNRRVVFGPVAITDAGALPPLPDARDLIDESRLAFRTLQRRERYDFERSPVSFTARPIRAASTACLSCHQDRKVGDPLGVVIFAYRESR